jgi:hypothetical protein
MSSRSALAFVLVIGSSLTPAFAQDPCAALKSQGASIAGFANAKVDTMKSGNNVICEMYAPDRSAKLGLIVEPASSAGGLGMRKMLAKNSKDPDVKSKDEPSLGKDAFSFSTRQQAAFSAAGKGGVYHLTLNRDAGVTPADEERLRTVVKKLVDGS